MTAKVSRFPRSRFPRRGPVVGYGWHSRSMAREGGAELLYRTPEGRTVVVTMVGTWRGARRSAAWPDMKYVGRVLMGWCKKVGAAES